MAIIVNGISIPTDGDYIKVGSTLVDKVDVVKDGVRTTVWQKQKDLIVTPVVSDWTFAYYETKTVPEEYSTSNTKDPEWGGPSGYVEIRQQGSYSGIYSWGINEGNWFTPTLRTNLINCSGYKKATVYYYSNVSIPYDSTEENGDGGGWGYSKILVARDSIIKSGVGDNLKNIGNGATTESFVEYDLTTHSCTNICFGVGIDVKKPNGGGGGFIGISKIVFSK